MGKLLWHQEDYDVASFLLGGWRGLPGMRPIVKKKAILVGSPGVGKSTLLCLMAFYSALKLRKKVLVYRQLTEEKQSRCLVYLAYDRGSFVSFTMENCKDAAAVAIYDDLIRQHKIENVWLFLDGFKYRKVPVDLLTFRMLATSQQVNLTSQERDHAYCILHPCWKKDDLAKLAKELYQWDEATVNERFYYSGGSVREFTRAIVLDIRRSIEDAVKQVVDPEVLFSGRDEIHNGNNQIDRLRHTFVRDAAFFHAASVVEQSDPHLDRYLGSWEQVVDSEFAVLFLSSRMRVAHVESLFRWASHGRPREAGGHDIARGLLSLGRSRRPRGDHAWKARIRRGLERIPAH